MKEQYEEILAVLEKNADAIETDYSIDIRRHIKDRIVLLDLSERFGIPLRKDSGVDWIRVSEHEFIGRYGEKYGRRLSWSDDGRQPSDEYLYILNFPTGAYIFGEEYPTETFNSFFNELKGYSPKYSDTANSSLYFAEDKAKIVHENFNSIYAKYNKIVGEEIKQKRIDDLKKKIEELESDGSK